VAKILREVDLVNERLRPCRRKVVECERCGREVLCYAFTNGCECGAEYNMSGQMLAARSQWAEDTYDDPYDDDLPGMSDDDWQMREWEDEG
jgi:hypothetical protein